MMDSTSTGALLTEHTSSMVCTEGGFPFQEAGPELVQGSGGSEGTFRSGCLCFFLTIFLGCIALFVFAQQGQITISRVELMPNDPQPYFMRDWDKVAAAYDSFVYSTDAVG